MAGNSISFPNRPRLSSTSTAVSARPSVRSRSISVRSITTIRVAVLLRIRRCASDCLARHSVNGNVAKKDWSFWEVYAKGVWTINDQWALGLQRLRHLEHPEHRRQRHLRVRHREVHRTGIAALAVAIGWYVSGEVRRTVPRYERCLLRHRLPERSFASVVLPTPTTRPGTSASASPGRCSPSTCATTTPTCRRVIATSTPAINTAFSRVVGLATSINPVGVRFELVRFALRCQAGVRHDARRAEVIHRLHPCKLRRQPSGCRRFLCPVTEADK